MEESRSHITTHKRALFVVQGAVAAFVGIALLTAPAQALLSLVTVLGGYWFVRGVANMLYIAIDQTGWHWKLFIGVLGLGAGVLALVLPRVTGATAFAVIFHIIGFQGIFAGFVEINAASKRWRVSLAILGTLSVMLGALLVFAAWVGVTSTAIVIGAATSVGGFAIVVAALRDAPSLQHTGP